jgi:multisubunit Na+/H+ antiporter MnhG subunit
MTPHMKWGIAGVIIGLILLFTLPGVFWTIALGLIVLAIAVPTVAYLMLDPAQRRRLKNIRRQREIR